MRHFYIIPMQQVQERISQLETLQETVTARYLGYQTALMDYMRYQCWLNLETLGLEGRARHEVPLFVEGQQHQELRQIAEQLRYEVPQQQCQLLHKVLQQARVLQRQFPARLTLPSQTAHHLPPYL